MTRLHLTALLTLFILLTPRVAYAGDPSESMAEAILDENRRDETVIAGLLLNWIEKDDATFRLGRWSELEQGIGQDKEIEHGDASKLVAKIGAVLWALQRQHPTLTQRNYEIFQSNYPDIYDVFHNDFQSILYNVQDFINTIHVISSLGSGDDFDIPLLHLLYILYTFKDDAEILTHKNVFNLLCLHACEEPIDDQVDVSESDGRGGYFTFHLSDNHFTTIHGNTTIRRSETENHVAAIYAWNYLATNFVLWLNALPTSNPNHPRADQSDPDLWDIREWVTNYGEDVFGEPANAASVMDFNDKVLQVVARPLHIGFAETNSRPYQVYTMRAIFALAMFGNVFTPAASHFYQVNIVSEAEKVKQGAINTLNYAAAKFAFQSLRSKRSAPFRRKFKYRNKIDFYDFNDIAAFFGFLSGAYEYNDCVEDNASSPECHNFQYTSQLLRLTQIGLPVIARYVLRNNPPNPVIEPYNLPEIIHGFMFDKRRYYHAIMQDYITLDMYPMWDNNNKYFSSPTTVAKTTGDFRGSPELYYGTGDILLAAGGHYEQYYKTTVHADFVREKSALSNLYEYHMWSRPTMLTYRGDYGHDKNAGNLWVDDTPSIWLSSVDVAQDTMIMKGNGWYTESECNVWVYKNVVYGYERHTYVDQDYHNGWAQRYPDWWNDPQYLIETWKHSDRTYFKFFHFYPGELAYKDGDPNRQYPRGEHVGEYYVIMVRMQKEAARWPHEANFYKYRRGIFEIVPAYLVPSEEEFVRVVKEWNSPDYDGFPNNDSNAKYKYVMYSSKERLTLDPRMGVDLRHGKRKGEGCVDGISKIEKQSLDILDPSLVDVPSAWNEVNREEVFIPTDLTDHDALKGIPLITVWELDKRHRHTGRKYVEAEETGKIVIRRPFTKETISPLTHDVVREEAWQCLILNSFDYTNPSSSTLETLDYTDCDADYVRPPAVSIANGMEHTCAALGDKAYCWGGNNYRQIGNSQIPVGGNALHPMPVMKRVVDQGVTVVESLKDVKQVAAGANHTCAVLFDRTVWCWGSNIYGQLGDGLVLDSTDHPVQVRLYSPDATNPSQMVPLTGIDEIALGTLHSCGRTWDGFVYCWGRNDHYQLGRPDTPFPAASQVDMLETDIRQISAGGRHTCARRENNELYCWGDNSEGQLGDGTTMMSEFPVNVLMSSAKYVSAGNSHTCALDAKYRPLCWGANQQGQLGNGNYYSSTVPVNVLLPEGVTPGPGYEEERYLTIDAGAFFTCAQSQHFKRPVCWGSNFTGQIGTGDLAPSDYPVPQLMTNAPYIMALSAGRFHNCVIDLEGNVSCWGANWNGQIGNDTMGGIVLTPTEPQW